jgi:sialate O-acetylesterase
MKKGLTILFILSLHFSLSAQITLPAFFSDGMVLQQNASVPLWGKASANSRLELVTSWDQQQRAVTTDAQGRWRVRVDTPVAGGPYSIRLQQGEELLTLSDLLIGEVWLCSGQSNMEMPMKGFKNQPVANANMDILRSNNPQIRLFTVKRASSLHPIDEVTGEWNAARPETVKEFSATAYYFGRLLQEILDVPVGLIASSWGGSPVESWMDREMLAAFPDIALPAEESDIKEKNRTPTTLYNGMIAPLIGYGMRGVIWYQGESNYDRPAQYTALFKAMVEGWRSRWGGYPFPFYYCQIAPYDYGLITPEGEEVINSAFLREAQLNAETVIPNSGMAVLIDAGLSYTIHPSAKQLAGERLALLALVRSYNVKGITADAPLYKEMQVEGDTVILSFDRAPMWLTAADGELSYFTVAGADRVFHKAKAWISRSKVYVISEKVKHPVAVRYAFENYVKGDLYGTEGLPLSSFRTDNW